MIITLNTFSNGSLKVHYLLVVLPASADKAILIDIFGGPVGEVSVTTLDAEEFISIFAVVLLFALIESSFAIEAFAGQLVIH